MIKKVSNQKSNSAYEIQGAKFDEPVACDDTTCDLQCTCQYPLPHGNPDSSLQFTYAMNYYCDHRQIWS